MNQRLNFSQINTTTAKNNDPKKTSRRCFLKKTAAFTGLVLSPLKLASNAFAADQQMDYLISNMSYADEATACGCTSACSAISIADFNNDHIVEDDDLREMARNWLSSSATHRVNIDYSHTWVSNSAGSVVSVDNSDFAIMHRDWLKTHCSSSASSTIY